MPVAQNDVRSQARMTLRIRVEEVRDGRAFKTCPCCGVSKEADDFGLRRKVGAGGLEVFVLQAWCRACRVWRTSRQRDPAGVER